MGNLRKISGWVLAAAMVMSMLCAPARAQAPETLSPAWFDVYNNGAGQPAASGSGFCMPAGAVKMAALNGAPTTERKSFGGLYDASNYTAFGSQLSAENYGVTFAEGLISTAGVRAKARLKGTSFLTDFNAGFTLVKTNGNSLYGGIAFHMQDDDFRNNPFGTRGYLLLFTSAADSTDVKVLLRCYTTATDYKSSAVTLSGLLASPTDGITCSAAVSGEKLSVTVAGAADGSQAQTTRFLLRLSGAEVYSSGSFALVVNGSHEWSGLSLSGTVYTDTAVQEKPVYGLEDRDSYSLYGSAEDKTDYGIVFGDTAITTAGQSKILLNRYTDIEDFRLGFTLVKTNGNSLYGGAAFRAQAADLTSGTYGGAGYLLFAVSAADSMDVTLYLRNYLSASKYAPTTVGVYEGLLAAPTDGVHIELCVTGTTAQVTLSDAVDSSRSIEASVPLESAGSRAGNYEGGCIALVSNGSHAYSDLSLARLVQERDYLTVENFRAYADFTLPDPAPTTVQGGIMFYVSDTVNTSPGLTGFSLNLIRTANSADGAASLQLVRYGTAADGSKNKNLGAITTKPVSGLLSSADGAGETVRVKLEAVRGVVSFSAENLATGKTSAVYTASLADSSTASSVSYNTAYSTGRIGYFTNLSGLVCDHLSVTPLADCTVSLGEYTGGTVSGGGTYAYGETVRLTAAAHDNYYFDGWYLGEQRLSDAAEYSFDITEDIELSPRFVAFDIRISGFDTEAGCAVIAADRLDEMKSIGCDMEAIRADGRQSVNAATAYINPDAAGKTPFLVTADRVYYCDLSLDGQADAADLAELRRLLLNCSSAGSLSDVNGDGVTDLRDLVRIKKALSERQYTVSSDADYTYAFSASALTDDAEKQYLCLRPFAEKNGNRVYGTAQYYTAENGTVTPLGSSPNHTPFGKIRISCIGDSITQGIGATGWQNGDYTHAYPQQLGQLLKESCTVENYGRGSSYVYYTSGRTASLWYPNTAEYAASNLSDPDIVIIKLGTNDARVITDAGLAQEWRAQFDTLIEHYQNLESHPQVYIVSCLTVVLYDENGREQNLVNYILPELYAAAEAHGCTLIDAYHDLYDFFTTEGGFCSDNLHPNDAGYARLAEYIAGKLDLDLFF